MAVINLSSQWFKPFLLFLLVFYSINYSTTLLADETDHTEQPHHIDNLADRPGFGALALDPHHEPIHDQGSQWAEGQPANTCLTNPTTNPNIGMGKTFKELRRWAWHWRRSVVNKSQLLIHLTSQAKGFVDGANKSHIRVPFWDYDPFSFDPYFQNLITWPEVYHPILIDYYNQSPWRGSDYSWDANTTKLVWFLEAQYNFNRESFLVGHPAKYDGTFNYYDRIPSAPVFDACIVWLEANVECEKAKLLCEQTHLTIDCDNADEACSKVTPAWNHALDIAAAHELAGREHLALIEKRIIYIWSFLPLVKAGVIK